MRGNVYILKHQDIKEYKNKEIINRSVQRLRLCPDCALTKSDNTGNFQQHIDKTTVVCGSCVVSWILYHL